MTAIDMAVAGAFCSTATPIFLQMPIIVFCTEASSVGLVKPPAL